MAGGLVDLGAYRAEREQDARDGERICTLEENIAGARSMLAMLAEAPELERLEPAVWTCTIVATRIPGSVCDDCARDAHHRGLTARVLALAVHARAWHYPPPTDDGATPLHRLVLCRRCVMKRLLAGRLLERQELSEPRLDRPYQQPENLPRWIQANASRLTERSLAIWLTDWHVPADQRVHLIDHLHDAWKQIQDTERLAAR